MNPMRVLLIIPAYNEANNIEHVIRNITDFYPQYDYVVVNDCSTDNTEEILKRNQFNYISLSSNLGIGGAVQAGYRYAKFYQYDIAVQIDGDGQHDPKYVAKVIQPIVDGKADMCIGSRFIEKEGFQSSFSRRMGIKYICWIIHMLCGIKITDATSGFRAVNQELISYYSNSYAQDFPEPEAIVSASLAGYTIKEEAVVMKERLGGESSINLVKSALYMIKVPLALILRRISMGKKKRRTRA